MLPRVLCVVFQSDEVVYDGHSGVTYTTILR